MRTSDTRIRVKILFHFNAEDHRFWLRWCQIELDAVVTPWDLHMDFQTVLDTIAYAKNLVLKHMTEKGLADQVEHVAWWIKGDETFYCPQCMDTLSHEMKVKKGPVSHEILSLRCGQCQTEVYIPADAFAFERSLDSRADTH